MASNLHSINHEQKLYVMHCGPGFSCYGFDVLDRKARGVLQWIATQVPYWPDLYEFKRVQAETAKTLAEFPAKGTAEHYEACTAAIAQGAAFAAKTGQRCAIELTGALRGLEGQRVEVTYPDGGKRRFWVGKSTGWMPCHLEIANRRSHGGGPVYFPEGSTVRVVDAGPR